MVDQSEWGNVKLRTIKFIEVDKSIDEKADGTEKTMVIRNSLIEKEEDIEHKISKEHKRESQRTS